MIWPFSLLFPKKAILNQLTERRPLPMGRQEFEEWSDRIISGALIPGATPASQKFALADMLLHLGPTVAFEQDGYFINCLRKFAVNQVADTMRKEIREQEKARLEAEKHAAELLASTTNENKVLAN